VNDNVARYPDGKRRYVMDEIPNPTLQKAVDLALKLMRQGQPPGLANTIAAKQYHVGVSAVARFTGQAAGTISGRRRRP
jgi:hypothetical protein